MNLFIIIEVLRLVLGAYLIILLFRLLKLQRLMSFHRIYKKEIRRK